MLGSMPTEHVVAMLAVLPPERAWTQLDLVNVASRQVEGILIISNGVPGAPAAELVAACRGGTPALVATWESGDNGGVLGRALVRLAG